MSDPKPDAAKPEAEKRVFRTLGRLHLDGEAVAAGKSVELDAATHAALFAAGVVEGDWSGAKALKAKT